MFKIKHDPVFPGSIKMVSMGREQTLNVTFRAKTMSEYKTLVASVNPENGEGLEDVFLALVEKWDADMDLNKESVKLLNEHQPVSLWHVINTYGESLLASRKGN